MKYAFIFRRKNGYILEGDGVYQLYLS